MVFDIGSFTDPLTKQKHTEMSITRHGGSQTRVMLRMKWCDEVLIRGGYAPDAGPYTQFAASPPGSETTARGPWIRAGTSEAPPPPSLGPGRRPR